MNFFGELVQVLLQSNEKKNRQLDVQSFYVPAQLLVEFNRKKSYQLITDGKRYSLNSAIPLEQFEQILDELQTFKMYTQSVPMLSRLPWNYQIFPQPVRRLITIILKNVKTSKNDSEFPSFPFDFSVDIIRYLYSENKKQNKTTTVRLTHDIDNLESLMNLDKLLDVESKYGFKSTNFIVPCKWNLDYGYLDSIFSAGFEIGIHGYNHGNKTPFLPPALIHKRMKKTQWFTEKYKILGYRAPSLMRTEKLLNILSEYFKYDSSIPSSGGSIPYANSGCATSKKFKVGKIIEMPISMPRDASLMFNGYKPRQILKVWLDTSEVIHQLGGDIVLLTHSDVIYSGNEEMSKIYNELLSFYASDRRFTVKKCCESI
jgi:peptidoglycan/xylan/chitin deacetylase (PgdA/CDA1 family)